MITVMGATGNTGKRICLNLLRAGVPVRALGRCAERLAPLAEAGAQVLVGEPSDAHFLTCAFTGADAVYTLQPYGPDTRDYHVQQNAQGDAIAQALRASQVPYVVALSSLGAELPGGNGPIASLHNQERRLRALPGTNVLVLRAGALFENFHGMLGLVREHGILADGVAPDVALPMVACRDVADVASRALLARDWRGVQVRELHGQRDISYAEAARVLGAAIGRSQLPYVQLAPEELEEALQQGGFSPQLASLYVELGRAISTRQVRALEPRTAANSTPTALESFAEEWAAAFRALG